jgi:hypothetical protein
MQNSAWAFFIGLAVAFGGALLNSTVSGTQEYQNAGIPLIIVGLFIACLGFGARVTGEENKRSNS